MSNLKRYENFEDIKADKVTPASKNVARIEKELKNVFEQLRSFKVKHKNPREIQPKENAG